MNERFLISTLFPGPCGPRRTCCRTGNRRDRREKYASTRRDHDQAGHPGSLGKREKRQYHSVFFEQLGDKPGDYFFPGESRERVFNVPGSFPYICEPHWQSHGMKGRRACEGVGGTARFHFVTDRRVS